MPYFLLEGKKIFLLYQFFFLLHPFSISKFADYVAFAWRKPITFVNFTYIPIFAKIWGKSKICKKILAANTQSVSWQPCGVPVLIIIDFDKILSILTTCGRFNNKSKIQLQIQRGKFRPRTNLSYRYCVTCTKVLNTEL